MSPFLSVIKRIVPRHQLSWSCLSAAIYAPLRQRHSQNEGGQPFVDTQRGKESKEIQSHDFHSDEKFSKKSLHRYISHDIQLANLELNELLEQEEGTRQLSVEQLELRGLAMFDLHLDPNFLQQERGGYSVRLFFEDGPSRSLTERSFRIKSFRVGKLVELGNEREPDIITGIVSEVKDNQIAVEVNWLSALILDEIVRKGLRRSHGMFFLRQRSHTDLGQSTIDKLKSCRDGLDRLTESEVARQIFSAIHGDQSDQSNQSHPNQESVKIVQKSFDVDKYLSPSQRRAVQLCANCHPVTLIHGPPGTGKTATLAAAVVSAALNGDRVLVTAPSHAACDAVTAAIAKHWQQETLGEAEGGNLIRLCNPLRLTDFSLNKYVATVNRVEGKYKEALNRASALKASMLAEKNRTKRSVLLSKFNKELSNLRWERNKHENAASSKAKVVVCTNIQASKMSVKGKGGDIKISDFDLVCYDEAGFSLETDVLPAVLASKRVIMSGDHLQLPPVVLSSEAKSGGLSVSLFEKLCRSMPNNVVLLNRQFRANSLISGWSSEYFYNSQVVADSSVASIALHDLPGVKETAETRTSLLFLDTAGEGYTETQGEDSKDDKSPVRRSEEDESIANHEEALVVEMVLKKFLFLGVPAKEIGVISPYWSQVELLRHLLWSESAFKNVEVRTVDGYQGREKELIILSLVRSNANRAVGFLRESRRINVSLTRAKRCCIVVGDRDTLSSDPAIRHFINFCRKNNALLPVKKIFGGG